MGAAFWPADCPEAGRPIFQASWHAWSPCFRMLHEGGPFGRAKCARQGRVVGSEELEVTQEQTLVGWRKGGEELLPCRRQAARRGAHALPPPRQASASRVAASRARRNLTTPLAFMNLSQNTFSTKRPSTTVTRHPFTETHTQTTILRVHSVAHGHVRLEGTEDETWSTADPTVKC